MRTRFLAMIGALGLLPLLAVACTEKTTVLPGDQHVSGITVSAAGSAFGAPDVAVLTLGVNAEAATVGAARQRAADAMNAMVDALKDGGVDEKDIQTARFSVQPRYDFSREKQVIIGFAVDNIAIVKVRDIDGTGELIDAALEAGGDLARVESIQFTIDDPTALEDDARRDAMEAARSKAETLADAGGVELGAPISISEGAAMPIPIDFPRGEGAADVGTTPIELGELEVQVSVQVVYSLK